MNAELQLQTDQLLKAAAKMQDWITIIHYDLLAIVLLVFVFGMIIAFKKRP
jgi:hypothetical protein